MLLAGSIVAGGAVAGLSMSNEGKSYRAQRGENKIDLPFNFHLRIVLSRLALTIQGSIYDLPLSPALLRNQRRIAVTSRQCPSISLISSGSSRADTSYTRMVSPEPVNKYGSARSVNRSGRIDLTYSGCFIGGGDFEVAEVSVSTWTVLSSEAEEMCLIGIKASVCRKRTCPQLTVSVDDFIDSALMDGKLLLVSDLPSR